MALVEGHGLPGIGDLLMKTKLILLLFVAISACQINSVPNASHLPDKIVWIVKR
jgi:hypothetical protein